MTTIDPTNSADSQLRRLEESIAGLRSQTSELAQSEARDQREMGVIEQRVRELEGRAISLSAEINVVARQAEDIQTLRERVGRFSGDLDAHSELTDASLRQLRQDLEAHREASNEAARRMTAIEKANADLRDRIAVQDETLRRLNAEAGDAAHQQSQIESSQQALGARIAANTETVRRASSEANALETRIEAAEREQFHLSERVELSYQSLRRVEETAQEWDDVRTVVEALRSRVEDSLSQLDASKLMVASVQREFEAIADRIGTVERVGENLRVRDARRERDVSSLGDRIESLTSESAQDQDKFIALQEQIRRRQIDDLEQEIRELKSFLRVRSDD